MASDICLQAHVPCRLSFYLDISSDLIFGTWSGGESEGGVCVGVGEPLT